MFGWFKKKKKPIVDDIVSLRNNSSISIKLSGKDYSTIWKPMLSKLVQLVFCEQPYVIFENDATIARSYISLQDVNGIYYKLYVPVMFDTDDELDGYNGMLGDIEDLTGISIEEFTRDKFKYLTKQEAMAIMEAWHTKGHIYAPYIPILKSHIQF